MLVPVINTLLHPPASNPFNKCTAPTTSPFYMPSIDAFILCGEAWIYRCLALTEFVGSPILHLEFFVWFTSLPVATGLASISIIANAH